MQEALALLLLVLDDRAGTRRRLMMVRDVGVEVLLAWRRRAG